MCKYCEEDKRKKRDYIINTPIVSLRIIRNNGFNALAIKSYNLEKQVVDSYQIINYCPKCRKEAWRVKSLKILLVLYIIITLMTLFIATNSNIIIEQRVWILTATYFIGMIAGLLAGYIGLSELIDKEDKQ